MHTYYNTAYTGVSLLLYHVYIYQTFMRLVLWYTHISPALLVRAFLMCSCETETQNMQLSNYCTDHITRTPGETDYLA